MASETALSRPAAPPARPDPVDYGLGPCARCGAFRLWQNRDYNLCAVCATHPEPLPPPLPAPDPELLNLLELRPDPRRGYPFLKDTELSAAAVLQDLAELGSVPELLAARPGLTPEGLAAVLAYAAQRLQERHWQDPADCRPQP